VARRKKKKKKKRRKDYKCPHNNINIREITGFLLGVFLAGKFGGCAHLHVVVCWCVCLFVSCFLT
jgi:hypothetical protein